MKQTTNNNGAGSTSWDFFWRSETNHRSWAEQCMRPAKSMSVEVPAGTSLAGAIEMARAAGMPKGSSRSGCFEIQTDDGIWSSKTGGRINPRTATFKTWDELEAEEAA